MSTWKLTGKPSGPGECEHCGRNLVHRYEVTDTETSRKMVVGRGCLKSVTGWTLTAAQAEREVRMIGVRAARAANWVLFAEANPDDAMVILADCEAYSRAFGRGYPAGASHEVKYYLEEDPGRNAWMVAVYMKRRHTFSWINY